MIKCFLVFCFTLISVCHSSFAQMSKTIAACDGTIFQSGIDPKDSVKVVEIYKRDTSHPPIFTGTQGGITLHFTDSIYYVRTIYKDTAREDGWLVIVMSPIPDASFTTHMNELEVSFQPVDAPTVVQNWDFGDQQYQFDTQGSITHTYSVPGTYTVLHVSKDTVNPFCSSISKKIITVPSTGIQSQNELAGSLTVYPNPAKDMLRMKFSLVEGSNIALNVMDMSGKVLRSVLEDQNYSRGEHNLELNISTFAKGIYIFRMEIEQQVLYEKFIKM